MVSQTEATTSRIQKEHARCHSSMEEEIASHGNALGDKALTVCKSLIAGGVSGGVSCSAVAPLERLKILLQVQNPLKPKYNVMVQGLKYICYEQASSEILWLYRRETRREDVELTPLLRLGAVACAGIIVISATYPMDMVQDWLVKRNITSKPEENAGLSALTKLGCGAATGTVGQIVAYPLDVVRRRMQMVGWKDASSIITADGQMKAPVQYTRMIDSFLKTIRNEGFGALYKGLTPNCIKVVPSIALAFVTYEVMKDLLGVKFQISD
ncbi:hypothetical protein GOP47_0021728 [Adiantum capillus-veneris]|uniref:Uncharacterized protein n=1 Tax=Adiantum capillus-veneris TaxID=13818 RepID=A0A9D4UA46_ADICA|nr:hypothetical protein GOP47_0021728 [Adiantum capillus-veneris]